MMDLNFLGTGCGVPSVERASPGLFVRSGDTSLLVDAGAGTLRQLARAELAYNDLDFIFFTHFHPDHTAELVSFLFAARYWPGFTREKPVKIIGPEGLVKLRGHLREAWGRWVEPDEDRVVFEELPAGERSVVPCGDFTAAAGPIPHTARSLGYRLTAGGKTLVVTGDTDYGPELIELARDADLLVTECSFPDDRKREGHLTPRLAGRAAREAGAKALALTHFYPETDGRDLLGPLREEFGGPITLARDLMWMTL